MHDDLSLLVRAALIVLGMLSYLFLVAIAAHRRFAAHRWLQVPPYALSLAATVFYFSRKNDTIEALILAALAVGFTWVVIEVTRKQIP